MPQPIYPGYMDPATGVYRTVGVYSIVGVYRIVRV